jgi:hypothetical protein
MNCSRCQGLMVQDHFMDFEGTIGHMWATSWRCMNCGHVQDSVIERNRLARPKPMPATSTGEPDYDDAEVHLGVESLTRQAA